MVPRPDVGGNMIHVDGMTSDQLLDLASEFTVREPSRNDSTQDSLRIVRAYQRDGSVKWAVYQGSWQPAMVLNRDGGFEYEPSPSNRDDEFYTRCRFATFQDAFRAAEQIAGRQQDAAVDQWLRTSHKIT